ncbi:MAG: hypothetical protein GXY83_44620 [Rhodopirellula sp.]|nr:hypothetical protein [Rhodopirellula sp.]
MAETPATRLLRIGFGQPQRFGQWQQSGCLAIGRVVEGFRLGSQFQQSLSLDVILREHLAISWRSAVGLNSAAPDFVNDIRFAYRF